MLESGTDRPSGVLVRAMGRNFFRRVPAFDPDKPYNATGDSRTEWFRTLKPGGLSNQWTGAVPRFLPEDFSEGGRLDDRYVWPLTYAELAPFYERVEKLMAITASSTPVPNYALGHADYRHAIPSAWSPVTQVARRHGQGLTALPLADGPPWVIARRGTAFNSFTNIVDRLEQSPHFQLVRGAHALRLESPNASGRVTSVLYQRRADGSQHRLAASAFIVACGPLNSTRLLFNSSSRAFPDGLGNSNGVLGMYLHDHPKEWWVFDMDRALPLLSPSAYLTRRPYESSDPLMATSWTLGVTSTKEKALSRVGASGRSVGVQVFGTMVPSTRHFVRPSATTLDAFGLPALDIALQFEADVIENMMQARRHVLNVMTEAGFTSTIREVEPQLHPGLSAHYGGTARMHRSRDFGVVDSCNRIFDAPNVLVCDASCFTTGAEKNPTLTAMALAARAADQLADELRTT